MKKELSKKFNESAMLPSQSVEINSLFEKILKYKVDQEGNFYNITLDIIMEDLKMLEKENVFAIDSEELKPTKAKKFKFDPILEDFVLGAGGSIISKNNPETKQIPLALRGLGRSKLIKECIELNRDFYFIDTGYFGNGKKKIYHRITKNDLQELGPVVPRPKDRLAQAGWEKKKFTKGSNILLCLPSEKVMNHFGLDLQQWISSTVTEIQKHTDRKIVIREKPSRSERVNNDTIFDALSRDVHCLVTFNSIAAIESLMAGKPAFTLGPNAAQSLCLSDLSKIETPYIPSLDEVEELLVHLAYCQFTQEELRSGVAWKLLTT